MNEIIFFLENVSFICQLCPQPIFLLQEEGFKDGKWYQKGLQKLQFPNSLVNWQKI